MGDGIKANLKMTGISLLVILVLIIILQNKEPVVTSILWVDIEMPRALLLFLTFATGFGSGYAFFLWRQKKAKELDQPEPVIEEQQDGS